MRISTVEAEGILQVARYRHLRLLLSLEEMTSLISTCQPFSIHPMGKPTTHLQLTHFLDQYAHDLQSDHFSTSAYWTADPEALYAIALPDGRHLIRPIRPVIELRPGPVPQFSYPHLYQHPKTQVIAKVDPNSPNSRLFKKLQRWARHNTAPIPV
jgi:hypothetical protein